MTTSEGQHLKHLEFIQAVVSRQATNSFLLKGWALTVGAAVYAFAAKQLNWKISLVAVVMMATFAWLDAYYLRQERLFRTLYARAIADDLSVTLFSLDTSACSSDRTTAWTAVLRSPPLLIQHGAILLVGLAVLAASLFK